MTVTVKTIKDSISPNGIRLTTLECKYPRIIHSEFLTHRMFSKNSASTRAIPTKKMADMVLNDMVLPERWGLNQSGMQAKNENLSDEKAKEALKIWQHMANTCAEGCKQLSDLGLHKQWAGRALETFQHITILVTATEWDNFFLLRDHEDAQPEIRSLAQAMKIAMKETEPKPVTYDEWHLPFIKDDEYQKYDKQTLLKLSTARCARVSYLTHDNKEPDIEKDIALYDRLVGSKPQHFSPTEHQATPISYQGFNANFNGWLQHRKFIETGEAIR